MSATLVQELFDQQAGSTIDQFYARTYTRVFLVVTDSVDDGTIAVETASAGGVTIPDIWSSYQFPYTSPTETDGYGLCVNIRSERQGDSPFHWKVYLDYATNYSVVGNDSNNPLNQVALFSGGSQEYNESQFVDNAGNTFVNSAGMFLTPLPELPRARLMVRITKNLSLEAWSPSSIAAYADHINLSSYLGFPAYSLRCTDVSFEEQVNQGVFYWATTHTFLFKFDLWQPMKYLNAGLQALVPPLPGTEGPSELKAIMDRDGNFITTPYPLQAGTNAGQQVTFGNLGTYGDTGINYLSFNIYSTFDFNSLGLYP